MNLVFKPTGEQVIVLPWMAGIARPWSDKHERVMFFHAPTSRSGQRCTEKIVRKDKLKVDSRRGLTDYK